MTSIVVNAKVPRPRPVANAWPHANGRARLFNLSYRAHLSIKTVLTSGQWRMLENIRQGVELHLVAAPSTDHLTKITQPRAEMYSTTNDCSSFALLHESIHANNTILSLRETCNWGEVLSFFQPFYDIIFHVEVTPLSPQLIPSQSHPFGKHQYTLLNSIFYCKLHRKARQTQVLFLHASYLTTVCSCPVVRHFSLRSSTRHSRRTWTARLAGDCCRLTEPEESLQ